MDTAQTDNHFTTTLIRLMVPIAIQQFFISGLALVDNIFVGQLGDVAVTSVSLANQIYFVLNLIYFGIVSGSAIFTAQYWGKQDVDNIRRVVGLTLSINLVFGIIFTLLAELIPDRLMMIYTTDPAVIALGSSYLRIYALGYIMLGVSQGLYGILRSAERVHIPMVFNSLALIINTSLGYVLIFGKLGMPVMGVMGVATANATARIVETVILGIYLISTRSFLLQKISSLFHIEWAFVLRFIKTSAPVLVNEVMWSLGVSAYNAIYAHISTEAAAAANISTTIESLAFVPLISVGFACAVMIGNRIGAGEVDLAHRYARRLVGISLTFGLIMGILMFISRNWVLSIYKISADTRFYTAMILACLSVGLLVKSWNVIMFIGVLRAGGDTRFSLFLEMGTMWLYGVPGAWIAAHLLHLPVYWVIAVVLSEELLKAVIVFFRFRSQRWIHHVTHTLPTAEEIISNL